MASGPITSWEIDGEIAEAVSDFIFWGSNYFFGMWETRVQSLGWEILKGFVSKVMSLLFNMLSWIVIAFLPRSKHLLISCLQSPSAVILSPQN